MTKAGKSSYDTEIIQTILAYRTYSKEKRRRRLKQNQFNWDIYNLKQDWRHKKKGQSKEFIPRLQIAIEQMQATTSAALTARADTWFSIEQGKIRDEIFDVDAITGILGYYLFNADSQVILSNAMRNVGLDGTVVAKVCGRVQDIPRFTAERGQRLVQIGDEAKPVTEAERARLKRKVFKQWFLAIDLVPFVDYYPDPEINPTGVKLFEIHEVERDLYDLIQFNEENKIYDSDVIEQISSEFVRQEEKQQKLRQRNEEAVNIASFRKRVTITECWGNIIDRSTGKLLESNIVATVCNDKYLIRPPEKNPRLDGMSPFVVGSLFQQDQAFNRALSDAPAFINKTANEQYNLILDGMMKEAFAVTQTRRGMLEDPGQVSGGLKPSDNLFISDTAPFGAKAVETVETGKVPAGAVPIFNMTMDFFNEAMLTNDLRLGQLPPTSTKATSVQIAETAIAGIFGSLLRVFEDKWIVPLLEKSWVEILQNIEDDSFLDEELINIIGEKKAIAMMSLSSEERFARGAFAGKFKVRGISAFVSRLRELQKLTTMFQSIAQDPELRQEFKKEYSLTKLMIELVKSSGIREDAIKLTEEEKEQAATQGKIQGMIEQAMQGAEAPQGATNGAGQSPQAPVIQPENDLATMMGPFEGNNGGPI